MKKSKQFVMSLALCILLFVSVTGCALDESTPTTSVTTNEKGADNSNLSMAMIGTYVGEDGSVLTFLSDGTADYYYQPDGKEPIQNQAWSVSGNRVTWKYDGRIDVYADVTNGEVSELVFKSDKPLSWKDEQYKKVTNEAAHWTVAESDNFLGGTNTDEKTGSTEENSPNSTSDTAVESKEELTVKVTNKENLKADYNAGRYSDRVNFTVEVTNNTDKPIQGVQGELQVNDLFGKKIMRSNCNFTGQTIAPGETATFSNIGLDINEFMDSHVKLYNENYDDLSFDYTVNEIVYANDSASASGSNTTSGSSDVVIICTNKTNIPEDISAGRYSSYAEFSFSIENKTAKTIKGIQGVFTISDLFGKEIKKINCDFTGIKIAAGETIEVSEKYLEINQFMDEDVKVYTENYEDLKFSYKVTDIVYVE